MALCRRIMPARRRNFSRRPPFMPTAAVPRMPAPIHTPTTDAVRTPSAVPDLPRANVLGVDLALSDYEGTLDWMDEVVRHGQRVCLSAAAVHLVMGARDDPEARRAVQRT